VPFQTLRQGFMLSARSSVADRIYGINEGADDYLPKPFSPAELVVRVKAILRRVPSDPLRPAGGRSELRHVDLRIDLGRYEVYQGQRLVPLTKLEFRLLAALIEAGGRVLTRDQLLDIVYGPDAEEVLDRTIDVHVGRLREKLGEDPDRPQYVATVRGVGYRAAPIEDRKPAPGRPRG
jgi:DNA-binding response OmpR family regulator